MSIINITSCLVCSSSNLSKAFDTADYFSSGEVFPVYECASCGFRFTNNFPSEDTIGKYYDSPEYISHSDTEKGLANRLYHHFRKVMLRKKVNLVASHVKVNPIRLLDIGCGTGYFLQAAKEQGWVVSGIEKNKKARENATARTGLKVNDEKSFYGFEPDSFDVVTLWHVLEHMENLNGTVDKLKEIINPQGIIVLALPNCHSYDAGFYKERWAAYDIPRHLWHFSPITIEKLLAKHNLQIIKMARMPLDAFYVSLLSEKYKGGNSFMQFTRAFRTGAIGFVRSIFDLEQSSSVIYIAKKI